MEENVIDIKGLKKNFGDKEVLKSVSFSVKKGENMIVMGRSGEGKSVTIKCIVGLIWQDEGSVKVFGKEVKEMTENELKEMRTKVGFLFQNAALYDSMTVAENLAFPLTRVLKIKTRIHETLDSVGLEDTVDKMPSDLSGGMRKRIGLARTLIVKPEIILYDEPTTGLDPITSAEISELILAIQKKNNASSIIITHDMQCAKITGDRMVLINEGECIGEGSYEELQHSPDKFIQSFFK